MFARVLLKQRRAPSGDLADYFDELVFGAGQNGDEARSRVFVDEAGDVRGFIGIWPRRMLLQGRTIEAAVAGSLMVDRPEENPDRRGAAAALVPHRSAGSFVQRNGQRHLAAHVGEGRRRAPGGLEPRLGARAAPCRLRDQRCRHRVPAGVAAAPGRRRCRSPDCGRWAAIPLAPASRARRRHAMPRPRAPRLREAHSAAERKLRAASRLGCSRSARSCSPTPRARSATASSIGASSTRAAGRRVGCYLYYGRRGEIARVLQVLALPDAVGLARRQSVPPRRRARLRRRARPRRTRSARCADRAPLRAVSRRRHGRARARQGAAGRSPPTRVRCSPALPARAGRASSAESLRNERQRSELDMCGIAGYYRLPVAPEERRGLLARMIGTLAHRGPDGNGTYIDGDVGLAHARLSIIDVDGGQQPMCNEDGTVWITFNGEIFNYVELRAELIARGHVFKTTSDTEVIVHLYEERGPDCVEALNGDFAFAIWDAAPAAAGAGARPRRRAAALLHGARRRPSPSPPRSRRCSRCRASAPSSTRSRSTRCSPSGFRWRRARRSRTSPSCRRRTCSWRPRKGITTQAILAL